MTETIGFIGLGNAALQRVGSSNVCSNLWWAEDAKENSDHGISAKIVGAVLGNVEAQSGLES